jgi:hypothetical protein
MSVVLAAVNVVEAGFLQGIFVQFHGDTDATPDPDPAVDELNRTYAVGWAINGVETSTLEVLKAESEYIAEPGVPVSPGDVVHILVSSPPGQGVKTPDWSSITGYVLISAAVWYFDMGEADYPAGGPNPDPTPAPLLLPADTYCGYLELVG